MQKEGRGGGSLFCSIKQKNFIVSSQALHSSLFQQGAFATPAPQTEFLLKKQGVT